MIITGYRHGAKATDAVKAIHKHTEQSLHKSKSIVDEALEGKAMRLPDDFVLREDLEDAGFIVE
jgi:hypothetical protein